MTPRHGGLAAVAAALVLVTYGAQADVVDRVRAHGVLHCEAEPRTGVAEDAGDGTLGGVAVALCRAVAAAVLGPSGKVAFRLDQPGEAAHSDAEISFTTRQRAPVVASVFQVSLALLVPVSDAARRPQDLAGRAICFMIGSDAQAALDAAFRRWQLGFLHMGYEEEDEMADAFAARRCAAVAGEAQELVRLGAGRILQPALAQFAVAATTPAGDSAWAQTVRTAWHHLRH